jgi:ubiquinone biosynthesis monooxygenase Coq6
VLKPDICIVGAGPAGAALACALAHSDHFNPVDQANKRIIIIDPSKLPQMQTYSSQDRVPEPRVVTLSPSSLRLLKSMGALQACNHNYITPFEDMLVYEQAGSAYMRFNNRMHSSSMLVQLQQTLLQTVLGEATIDKL